MNEKAEETVPEEEKTPEPSCYFCGEKDRAKLRKYNKKRWICNI